MEKIATLLDVCQENLLKLIEKDSADIEDQVQYWRETQREHTLLYAAKKMGATRLGFQPVPPLAVSEQKAKLAIKMQLTLQSLKESVYGQESWTLPETSQEMLDAEPKNCFKKHGQHVTVLFENDIEKAVQYVLWKAIYVQDNEGHWHVTPGEVNYDGLTFQDPEMGTIYYVLFAEEAKKYGDGQPWVVHTNSGRLFSPSSGGPAPNTPETLQGVTSTPSSLSSKKAELSFWGSPGSGGPVRGRNSPRPPARPRRPQAWTSPGSVGLGGRQRQWHRRRTSSPFRASSQTAKRFEEAAGHSEPRAGGNPSDSCPHPVLIFKGPSNTLKCWRFRLNKGYRKCFYNVSSTFSMVGFGNKDGYLLITFESHTQLTAFKDSVPRPKNLEPVSGRIGLMLQ